MGFNSETGAAAGRKGGPNRWKDKDPDTVRRMPVHFLVSKHELEMINSKAAEAGLSRAEFLVTAAKRYRINKKPENKL